MNCIPFAALSTLVLFSLSAPAQTYTLQAVAGTDPPTEGPGLRIPVNPVDIVAGPDGQFFVSDQVRARIWRISADFATVASIAGTGVPLSTGDGGPAANAAVAPFGLAYDTGRRLLYFSQPAQGTVRAIDLRTGVVTTVAGNGSGRWLPGNDGKPAREVPMTPEWIAVDEAGHLYISDKPNYRIYRVDATSRAFETIAGIGLPEINPFNPQRDGKPAKTIPVWPERIAASGGTVIFCDELNMGRIDAAGIYRTHVRNWINTGEGVENGGGTIFSKPVFQGGSVLLADWLFWRVYSWSPSLTIEYKSPVDQILFDRSYSPTFRLNRPALLDTLLNFANDGTNFLTITRNAVWRAAGQQLVKVVGFGPYQRTMSVDDATFGTPYGLALRGPDELLVSESNGYLRIVNLARKEVRIPNVKQPEAELFPVVDGQVAASVLFPDRSSDFPVDSFFSFDRLFSVAVNRHGEIRFGVNGDTLIGVNARESAFDLLPIGPTLTLVTGLVALPDDTLVVADWGRNAVRHVSASGSSVRTLAGNGTEVFKPGADPTDTGLAPYDVAVATSGLIYILDRDHHRVYKLDREINKITLFAGTGEPGFSGDGADAGSAQLRFPEGIATGPGGEVFIADSGNCRIRRIGADGIIQTIAGTGEPGNSGNGGPALAGAFTPARLVVAPDGTIYFSDAVARRIRRLMPLSADGTAGPTAGVEVRR